MSVLTSACLARKLIWEPRSKKSTARSRSVSALGAIVALGERMTVLPKITCDHAGAWNDDDTPATDGARETGTGVRTKL